MDTFSLDCKHKHMLLKTELHLKKIWCPIPSVTYRIPWFYQQDRCFRVITLWFLVLVHFHGDGMGPFNNK